MFGKLEKKTGYYPTLQNIDNLFCNNELIKKFMGIRYMFI